MDYGSDHSTKYGHLRFGHRFVGTFKDWSSSRPIVLLSHSHGGNTCRMLQHLLHHRHFESNPDTRASWILAICCVASPLRGCSMLHRLGMPRLCRPQSMGPWYSAVRMGQTLGYTLYLLFGSSRFYRWGLEKWQLKLSELMEIWNGTHRVMNTDDTAAFELTPDGASELNRVMSVLYVETLT